MTDETTPHVGYMSPPEHSRFRKGKSGNPRGRPKKREDLDTILNRVLTRKITVKDSNQKMVVRDALIWKLRELALRGDRQALALQRRIIDESGIADPNAHDLEETRIAVIEAFKALGVPIKS